MGKKEGSGLLQVLSVHREKANDVTFSMISEVIKFHVIFIFQYGMFYKNPIYNANSWIILKLSR